MDLDLNLPPQVVTYLDLNFSPHEEEEEDVEMPKAEDVEMPEAEDVEMPEAEDVQMPQAEDVEMPEAEDVEMPEAEDVEIPAAHAQSRELPDSHRFAAYIALKALGNDRKIAKADKELVATLLKTSLSTIERIWRKGREQEIKQLEVDVSNQKRGRCGRKRADLGLSRMPSIPLNKRSTLRALARELGVAYATLQRRFQWGKIRRHTSTLKPALKPENKIARLKFCTSMIDQTTTAEAEPSFLSMENIVHIDEKWFDMTKRSRKYYLLPEEQDPVRTIHNKNSIGKQDNARTHVLPNDPIFLAAVKESGRDIKLLQQPPNSPDLNALDLGFFSSIQSLTVQYAPTTLKELIESVEQAFDGYDVDTLVRVFITLQTVMIEVMRVEGDNTYDIKHMGKVKLQREGNLPMILAFDGTYYRKSLEIIANHEAALDSLNKQEEEQKKDNKMKEHNIKRKARRIGPRVIVDNETIIPGSLYATWLDDPSDLVSRRRRISSLSQEIVVKLPSQHEIQEWRQPM
ncbi:hypothetical protein QYE76_003764 [Lolium multiflorum]|uniref:Uncharacterized protein n=1 Tax=Lolium multiflorum TaxID=4521 RepID=A0AAD8W0S1_LOLMU|nr:hypothetical protein QYE76_003764 [Lolium multiflorum]